MADILGGKRIYGYEVLILAIGALAFAFAPDFTFLPSAASPWASGSAVTIRGRRRS